MNVVLIGFRGSGKTTLGRLLAAKLKRPFYDVDQEVERRTGRTIREIVEAGGWEAFRNDEKDAIRDLCGLREAILAPGGGAVLDADNVRNLKRSGKLFWLKVNPRTAFSRICSDQSTKSRRPSLTPLDPYEEVVRLIRQREPFYRKAADVVVETDGNAIEVLVQEILDRM